MTVQEVVTQFLSGLVEMEVKRLLPFVAHMIPGVPGQLASQVVSQPEFQAKLVEWEKAGVVAVVGELAKAVEWLSSFVASHVKGNVGAAVAKALHDAPPAPVSLSADQVRQLAILAAAGKLEEVLSQALKDLGVLPVTP